MNVSLVEVTFKKDNFRNNFQNIVIEKIKIELEFIKN